MLESKEAAEMYADCHIHMVLDGLDWRAAIRRHEKEPDLGFIRAALEAYRAGGFTYLRDGGDRWGVGAAARELAPGYGITYRTPLAPLHKAGHYGGFIGRRFADLEEFTALAKETAEAGGDFLKIMISGLMDFSRPGVLTEPGLDPAEIRALITAARDLGLSVMVHGNGDAQVEAAARAGAASVEHGAYLGEAALTAMAEMGTVWVPTLSTIGNLRGKGRYPDPAVEAILAGAMENVRRFAAMGGLIAPGTDAGAWAVPHGGTQEYALLAQAIGPGWEAALEKGVAAIRERF